MKREEKLWLLAAVTIPLFLFFSLWQVFRFEKLKAEIAVLNEQQNEWFDANRKLVSSVAVYSSPERISRIAEGRLKLSRDEERDIVRIVIRD